MKKTIFTFILSFNLLFNFNFCFGQSGWFWQNPLPQGNTLQHIYCVNQNVCFAGGYNGTLIKTTNSGLNWYIVMPNSTYIYGPFSFINENTGFSLARNYASSGDGKIMKTTNGGNSWNNQNYDTTKTFFCIHFPNENTGYCAGFGGVVFKTINGGTNWVNVSINSTYAIRSIYFLDGNTGFGAGYISSGSKRLILKTINGGSNWDAQIGENNRELYRVSFTNYNTGIAIGDSWIYRTTDGGNSWNLTDSFTFAGMRYMKFVNSTTGYIAAPHYSGTTDIYKTTNAGINWMSYNSDLTGTISSLDFGNENVFFSIDDYNIFSTSNSGYNWFGNIPVTEHNLHEILFTDNNIGYIVGNMGTILKTTNSGINWLNISTDTSLKYTSIYFLNPNFGYIGGYNGTYPLISSITFKTSNGGLNWTSCNSGTIFFSMYFLDNNTGFGCGFNSIKKTIDGGLNWVVVQSNSQYRFNKIQFLNNEIGYACGGGNTITPLLGILYKTTNGGNSWFNLSYYNGGYLNTLFFLNQDTGYISQRIDGYGTYISKTTNGGSSWEYYGIPILAITSLFFTDNNMGHAVGVSGNYYQTTDGGSSWFSPYINITNETLNQIYFINYNTGFCIGNWGQILKTTNGGNLLKTEGNKEVLPFRYILSQNYPNPFNPTTKIKFNIPAGVQSNKSVKLFIYDILGREITTLVNEQLKPGTYEIDWDGSSYASGVYFYKLVSGDYAETKKMVLMK